jgi:hypothetical protein
MTLIGCPTSPPKNVHTSLGKSIGDNMGLLDRDYMKEPNKPSKRRKVKTVHPKPKKANPKISRKDKKVALDAFMKGTPVPPPKPSFWQRLFKPQK